MAQPAIVDDFIDKITTILGSNIPADTLETRNIPSGSEDAVTMEEIKTGDGMVDFHDEYKNGRYYKESTFYKLNRKNPFTRKAITESKKYTAKVTSGGRRRTRKHKKSSKH
jgi:hypothetical protein